MIKGIIESCDSYLGKIIRVLGVGVRGGVGGGCSIVGLIGILVESRLCIYKWFCFRGFFDFCFRGRYLLI